MFHHEPGVYEMYKADTGAVRFKVRYPMGTGFATFSLTSKDDPKTDIYQIFFGPTYKFTYTSKNGQNENKNFHLAEPIGTEFREFWMTWHSNVICLGVDGQAEPILTYANDSIVENNIGFIKFYVKSVRWFVDWQFEASPVVLKQLADKKFNDGCLHWATLELDSNEVPDGALIGGFEYEPLYIMRAPHNGSMCPGKYIKSKQCGYVAWGGREHEKPRNNQLLCGYNAKWVKTQGNKIPENAFVAGYSEVRREPLYIGRAYHKNQLLVGKVHPLYCTCYLPYQGKEIETGYYEILVSADVECRTVPGVEMKKNVRSERNYHPIINRGEWNVQSVRQRIYRQLN